jgi:cellulose biosynthesis protein BcsQ
LVSPGAEHQTESRRLFEDFKLKSKVISDQLIQDNKFNKLTERLENNLGDAKFDEYISERMDFQKFVDMGKEMTQDKKKYLIEQIAQKTIDKRSVEEKRFFTWHLKFRMPFFKQYPYE